MQPDQLIPFSEDELKNFALGKCDPQRAAEIEAALQRLDDGTFGVDEVTGDPIDPERLEALPTARTNVPTARTDVPPARS